ncbi:hypothetical protein [Clavibacter michiganensis]|uniref:hypothetical protein n=1 Tax=Clavibacter michiganensis TaxID=28447 RepID=UPI001BE01426|nr:hypothetical protein [Clavibacter michiganensis]MBT1636857.1 hypothetical protein [Clavibacter michiganensis]
MPDHEIIPAYRHGTPLRAWTDLPEKTATLAADLLIKSSDSIESVRRLLANEEVSQNDVIAFGRLNFRCFLSGWEPLVALFGDPLFSPEVAPLLPRYSKHFM